ncbi:MAG: hypothetical protein R6W77_03790 [Trueperaceae bacterium]
MDDLRPLHLAGLARSAAGEAIEVPGADLRLQRIDGSHEPELNASAWLVVLDGRVIVDLPHGDFRVLERLDALRLPAHLDCRLVPVDGAAIVAWHGAT